MPFMIIDMEMKLYMKMVDSFTLQKILRASFNEYSFIKPPLVLVVLLLLKKVLIIFG